MVNARVKVAPDISELHPRIVEFFQRNKDWHERHGFEQDYELEDVFKDTVYIETPEFIILITDDSEDYHGNVGMAVFNKDGILVDARNFYHEDEERSKAPSKAFNGVPVVNGNKPVRLVPRRKRDRDDPLQ